MLLIYGLFTLAICNYVMRFVCICVFKLPNAANLRSVYACDLQLRNAVCVHLRCETNYLMLLVQKQHLDLTLFLLIVQKKL